MLAPAGFPTDVCQAVIGCALRQKETADALAAVHAEYRLYTDGEAIQPAAGRPATKAARAQIARILSLDADGTGFPAPADADPVVAALQTEFLGLRPVLFYAPCEAAAWTIIGNRIRMTEAAHIKARLAQQYGEAVEVEGRRLHAFPTPDRLLRINDVPGLTDIKIERLHALTGLKELPGIGPFSAELILIRGAGHPDVFPTAEPRVHRAMAAAYGLDASAADTARLAAIADAWRPYRSWIALLLRAHAQDHPADRG